MNDQFITAMFDNLKKRKNIGKNKSYTAYLIKNPAMKKNKGICQEKIKAVNGVWICPRITLRIPIAFRALASFMSLV